MNICTCIYGKSKEEIKAECERIRAFYKERAEEWKNSEYRREKEYADYLNAFFYLDGIVDGMPLKARENLLETPMSYNIYFS